MTSVVCFVYCQHLAELTHVKMVANAMLMVTVSDVGVNMVIAVDSVITEPLIHVSIFHTDT